MISYELAKKLKDAGFLLKPASQADSRHNHKMFQYGKDSIGRDNTWWLEPSLSELIEACLEKHCVFKLYCWEHGFVIGFQKEEIKDDMKICNTPEEAVALLWLELNKK